MIEHLPEGLKPLFLYSNYTYEQLVVLGDFLRYISNSKDQTDIDTLCRLFWSEFLQKPDRLFTYPFSFLFKITENLKSQIDIETILFNCYLNIYKQNY